jgi:hypothetical protein
MATLETPGSMKEFPLVVIKQMITLSTAGFGVVVGLAWNEVVKNAIDVYIKPLLGNNSGVVSLFIYATVVTVLAVVVTMQLSKAQRGLEQQLARKEDRLKTPVKKN